jgi:hypothetical protein
VLVSSISSFFANKTSLVDKWMSFSSSNLALAFKNKIAPMQGICHERLLA